MWGVICTVHILEIYVSKIKYIYRCTTGTQQNSDIKFCVPATQTTCSVTVMERNNHMIDNESNTSVSAVELHFGVHNSDEEGH